MCVYSKLRSYDGTPISDNNHFFKRLTLGFIPKACLQSFFPRRTLDKFAIVPPSLYVTFTLSPKTFSCLDAAAEEEATTTPGKTTNTNSFRLKLVDLLPTVMIQRNWQSMSFREGNPLVFSDAISYTYQTTTTYNNTKQQPIEVRLCNDGTSLELALGTLVQVAVSPKKRLSAEWW